MRDFIEDAHKHREDGYGRAQASSRVSDLPKRFYKLVGVKPVEGGFGVTLDDRGTKTPGRVPVVVPVEGLARLMAAEWEAQGERIDAETMPMVRLINAAVESGGDKVATLRDEIIKYAGNDLLLYRADSPRELVAAEEAIWDDALVRLARHFGVSFQPTIGILHQHQPPATLTKLAAAIETEELLAITALVSITSLTGSGLLVIGLRHGLFTPDETWAAAHVDEDYNTRLWGEMEETAARQKKRRREFDVAVKVLELLAR